MLPSDTEKTLCVSIHDVAPQTWPQCRRLLDTIAEVADIPVTLLVVPCFHGVPVSDASGYERALESRLAHGDELALHGYRHLDDGPPPRTLPERFVRRVYTRSEGEFAALDTSEACRRIELGLEWFSGRGWPVRGFVAPAWLMGPGTWQALERSPFSYTTTLGEFHLLPQHRRLRSPSLVYAARNAATRFLSRRRNTWLVGALRDEPLLRFGLHPADAAHPELLADCRRLLAYFLETRQPATKAAFAAHLSSSTSGIKPSAG